MAQLRTDLLDLCEAHRPVTVRGVYYLAVTAGVVDKTEAAYKRISDVLAQLRKSGVLPYGWIKDHTRRRIGGNAPESLEEYLEECARFYRKNIWANLPVHVEIWTEKETLTGVLTPETEKLGVGLFPCRGYASLSFLHAAAAVINAKGKPACLYFLGDLDPSGVNISETVERGINEQLRDLGSAVEITFKRLAVNPDQVKAWDLPTRPTKKTDSRSKNFQGESVEVEAIPPAKLRRLVREAVESHIPEGHLDAIKTAEESEREAIRYFTPDIEAHATPLD